MEKSEIKIIDLCKLILTEGFTPEIRKQIEAGTYSSEDIADLMETIAAGNSALEKRVAELEGRTDYTKTTADDNPASWYPQLGIPLPALANKKEAKNALKLLKEHHLKGRISDTVAAEMTKTYQSRLEEIAKNSWYDSTDLVGCAFVSAFCGIGTLVAAGIYVGSYLAVSEIGGVIGGVIPPVICAVSDSRLSNRGSALIGTVVGAISGIAAACIAYEAIPDFASQEAMNIIGKGMLSGCAGGIVGLIASLIYTYGDDPF